MFEEEPNRLLVDKVAVFDAPHTSFQRLIHGARMVSVHRDVAVIVVCFDDGGTNLLGRVLHRGDLVCRRSHTPGDDQLEVVGTLAELVAGSPPDFLDSVGDPTEVRLDLTAAVGVVSERPEITVSAGLRDRFAAEDQTGTDNEPFVQKPEPYRSQRRRRRGRW